MDTKSIDTNVNHHNRHGVLEKISVALFVAGVAAPLAYAKIDPQGWDTLNRQAQNSGHEPLYLGIYVGAMALCLIGAYYFSRKN
jgi:hypothetical protein